jgi:hypothetical protein
MKPSGGGGDATCYHVRVMRVILWRGGDADAFEDLLRHCDKSYFWWRRACYEKEHHHCSLFRERNNYPSTILDCSECHSSSILLLQAGFVLVVKMSLPG